VSNKWKTGSGNVETRHVASLQNQIFKIGGNMRDGAEEGDTRNLIQKDFSEFIELCGLGLVQLVFNITKANDTELKILG